MNLLVFSWIQFLSARQLIVNFSFCRPASTPTFCFCNQNAFSVLDSQKRSASFQKDLADKHTQRWTWLEFSHCSILSATRRFGKPTFLENFLQQMIRGDYILHAKMPLVSLIKPFWFCLAAPLPPLYVYDWATWSGKWIYRGVAVSLQQQKQLKIFLIWHSTNSMSTAQAGWI